MKDERDMRERPDDMEEREPGSVREPIARREDVEAGEEMPRHDVMAREDMKATEEPMRPGATMAHEDEMARKHGMAHEGMAARPKSTNGPMTDMWPDMTDLHKRFESLQSEFIDDPKGAVEKAEKLINDVIERITRSMHERIDAMHKGVEGTHDTEQLRQTMRSYRDLVVWMETRRAA